MTIDVNTDSVSIDQVGKLSLSEPVEAVQSVDFNERTEFPDNTNTNGATEIVNDQKREIEDNNDVNQVQTQFMNKTVISGVDRIQSPDKAVAESMSKSLPEGEKLLIMGCREDGSNYMITTKTKAEATVKDAKIETINVLEFDGQGIPIRFPSGQIKTISLPMGEYKSKLSAPRDNLLKQAQQDLANFKRPDNLQQKTDEYQQQEAAYTKAKATRDNLEQISQSDPSVQAAYDKSKKDYQSAQQAFSAQDPQETINRLENKVNQYSDKKTRIATAEKKLQDAKLSSVEIIQKRTSLEVAFKNESNVVKRTQIFSDLQAIKSTEYFADQDVKDAVSKLQTTKNSTYSTDVGDFQAVFDDVTAQFINDSAVMDSLKDNKDYQDYRAQVTTEIYKPAIITSTMNGIKDTIIFMADIDLGKAFKTLTPSKDPGKYFRSLAKEAKYKYSGKSSQFQL
jgi:hypothetical protein